MENNSHIQIVILGITGDLSKDKLLPSLFQLFKKGLLPIQSRIVGVSRSQLDTNSFLEKLEDRYQKNNREDLINDEKWGEFKNIVSYISGDFSDADVFNNVSEDLEKWDNEKKVCADKIMYFSTIPDIYPNIIDGLKNSKFLSECKQSHVRVVVEKPFGTDYKSAKILNNKLLEIFQEEQIFRIDHVLGKDPLVDIISFRKNNPLIASLLETSELDHIQVSYLESEGIKDRANYYDQTGIVRDMVQNHLLQIVALMTMEIPSELNSDSLSASKSVLIQKLSAVNKSDVVIGQYNGYKDEVSKDSFTPTFIALKTVLHRRDRDIPIYMRTGKKLENKYTEISLVFKDTDIALKPNILSFRIQPNSGIYLVLKKRNLKLPEKLENIVLDYCYRDNVEEGLYDAYENLLMQVIKGDRTYFIDIKEVLRGWEFVDHINVWIDEKELELKYYEQGSWGPMESKELIEREGRKWYTEDFELVCRLH